MSNTELVRQNQLKSELVGVQRQIESLLSDKERARKFLAASLVVANNLNLNECSTNSIVNSLVGVAMLDLNIDPNLGHVYLVPYKGNVQLQIGYKGMIQMLFRAGWAVKAFPVFNCDRFNYQFDGWDNTVSFDPNIDERDEGDRDWCIDNLRGIFVIARHADTKDQYSTFVSKNVLEKMRRCSPNQNTNRPTGKFWYDWYIEMCMSKAIKKLAKMLPIGDSRAAMSIAVDDVQESGKVVNFQHTVESGIVEVDQQQDAPSSEHKNTEINDIIQGDIVIDDEPIDFTPPISGIEDKVAACNTLAELARFVAELDPAVKMENKELIQARQEQIKQARKEASNGQ